MKETKIYLDFVFLQDFLIDYLLLVMINRMLHKRAHLLRRMAGAAVGGLGSVASCLLLPYRGASAAEVIAGVFFQLIVAAVMLIATFAPFGKKEFLIAIPLLYGMTFLAEGVIRWLNGYMRLFERNRYSVWMLLGAGVFFYGFAANLVQMIKSYVYLRQSVFPVQIFIGGQKAEGKGFMDSGNALVEPITKRPVIVVEASFLAESGILPPDKGYFMIPFCALGCEKGMLRGFLADRIVVDAGDGIRSYEKVMLGIYEGRLSRGGEYRMLLHPCL